MLLATLPVEHIDPVRLRRRAGGLRPDVALRELGRSTGHGKDKLPVSIGRSLSLEEDLSRFRES